MKYRSFTARADAIIAGPRMRCFEFPDKALAIIHRERFYHPGPSVQGRMEVLWLILTLLWKGGLEAVWRASGYTVAEACHWIERLTGIGRKET